MELQMKNSKAKRLYGERFPSKRLPDRKTFEHLHIQLFQELTRKEYPRRMEFAHCRLYQDSVNPDFQATLFFMVKCMFRCQDTFSIRNPHAWVDVYSHANIRMPLSPIRTLSFARTP
ncbi:hypothetical protein TNCV_1828921 [Trichonephila clavipes]|nr:hypothetical protein TNCV_1828921 [Trichonephila clavipes]